jgi:hypothetical protein
MKIVSKFYDIEGSQYGVYDHYKDILIAFQSDLLKAGIKRIDYGDVDFCGAEGVNILLNGVTNPKAWKILEEKFGYESHYGIDEDGEEHED